MPMRAASVSASVSSATASSWRPRASASSPSERETSPKHADPDAVMPTRPRYGASSSKSRLAPIGQAERRRDLGLRLGDGQPEVVPRDVALRSQGACSRVQVAVHHLGEGQRRVPGPRVRAGGHRGDGRPHRAQRSVLVRESTDLHSPGAVGVGMRVRVSLSQRVDTGLHVGLAACDVDGDDEPFGEELEELDPGALEDGAQRHELIAGFDELAALGRAVRGEEPAEELHLRVAGADGDLGQLCCDLATSFQRRRLPQADELGVQHGAGERGVAVPPGQLRRLPDECGPMVGVVGERRLRGERGEDPHAHRVVGAEARERVLAEADHLVVRVLGDVEERPWPGRHRRGVGDEQLVAGRFGEPDATAERRR